ncbi:amino acid ABC transporter substrate-binding protein (PAAT family) [Roseiarcus fermentans]|uniref:Amino acid ABC transporter substrate-binding protein (PAAT family) n=1 Tax=Roseiarcus fermentans TaxID=1473586 RepID=A0A366FT18_9HYPH|nr:amino acid ABC transporter substrate-binding protein [Roseiarcus fermentans]RBP17681.1 amino acid ABC transporter substrate-binding protein (PAAT family) [Roseiarcus fermentans]
MRMIKPLLAAAAALALAVGAADAQTLKTVQDRGKLVCGVSQGIAGFSIKDDKGEWSGFDVDFCRALAAAIFNDPSKVEFVPLTAAERFDALKDKKIDVLSRNSTWTLGREEDSNVVFAGVTYYDGQAFMTPKAAKATSALELDGAKVCVQKGTTSIPNVKDFFEANHVTYEIVEGDTVADLVGNYLSGKCTVLTTDESQLFALRSQFPKPGEHAILPDVISKEPLGPVVRQDDMQWLNLVKWMNFALLNAEEMGVSSKTIDEALQSQKPAVKRLVGTDGDFGKGLGLSNAWAANAVRSVGNYGEIFDRNVGAHTLLGIPRGLNELWDNGGIQYAPPIR